MIRPRQSERTLRSHDLADALIKVKEVGITEFAPKIQLAAELATGREMELEEESHALRSFLNGGMSNFKPFNEDLLWRFVFETPLGRLLRRPQPDPADPYRGVLDPLFKGINGAPHGADFSGLFFVYHGSYKKPRMVAVHLMEVTAAEGGLLRVTDYISDQKFASEPIERNSIGCMTFVQNRVQILTSGQENRIGYSLFVGTPQILISKDRPPELIEIIGDLYGTNDDNKNFARKALIKPQVGAVKELVKITGIFTSRELKTNALAQMHMPAFQGLKRLAKAEKHELTRDPILGIHI